ncbi:hypothetical protein ACYTTR_13865, partial [Cobetia marina]
SFTTDWRFAPSRSRELVNAMIHAGKNVSYANIDSPHGHDAFLLPGERYQAVLGNFLTRAYDKACNAASPLHTAPQEASHA